MAEFAEYTYLGNLQLTGEIVIAFRELAKSKENRLVATEDVVSNLQETYADVETGNIRLIILYLAMVGTIIDTSDGIFYVPEEKQVTTDTKPSEESPNPSSDSSEELPSQ